jgi:hypothetical protein
VDEERKAWTWPWEKNKDLEEEKRRKGKQPPPKEEKKKGWF